MRIFLAAFIVLLLTTFSGKAQNPVHPQLAQALQAKLDSCIQVYDLPGAVVSMRFPGDRHWLGISGYSDPFAQIPLDSQELFYQASVTKMYTAAMVMKFIQWGQLRLDDSIGSYVAPLPHVRGNTRIRHLLNHRSGLYDIFSSPGIANTWYSDPDSVWDDRVLLTTFMQPPLFAEGAAFSYSNTNYLLLGMALEQISGRSFAQLLRDSIFVPYGMQNSFLPPNDSIAGFVVSAWTRWGSTGPYDQSANIMLNPCFASMGQAAGSLVALPAEVSAFNRLLYTGQFIPDSLLNTMMTCSNVSFSDGCNGYGHGAMRYTYSGKYFFGHSGDINGFTTQSIHQREDSLTLSLSINRDRAPRGAVSSALIAAYYAHQAVSVENPTLLHMQLFPNPVQDRVFIRSADLNAPISWQLVDIQGRVQKSGKLEAGAGEIRMDELATGVYFIAIKQGLQHWNRKISKL